ncbi:MAG: class I SAM-dependent methyltransferase [Planctomycetia bacterium]|nr:class I SAM-dependent methyltransferase [Planctomycetia bacterium]
MRDNIRSFVASAAESFPTVGTVYEFGSYIVPGQERIGDLRSLFPGRKYVGCDMRAGPGVDRIEDLGSLTLPDNSASTIVCVETLEHVFEVRRAADELMRVLAPGGVLLISTPFNFYLHNHPDDYWRLTPSCLQSLLAPLSATLVGWQGVDSFPHTVFAVACKAPVPEWFATGIGRFTTSFQSRLRALEAAEPWQKKLKSRLTGWLRSKGERRREQSYYRSQWMASYSMAEPATKVGLRTLQKVAVGLQDSK